MGPSLPSREAFVMNTFFLLRAGLHRLEEIPCRPGVAMSTGRLVDMRRPRLPLQFTRGAVGMVGEMELASF